MAQIVSTASTPAFKPAEPPSHYSFDTGVARGVIRANGKYQGIIEMVHTPTGVSIAHGGSLPGIFSYYRVFSNAKRYGNAVRDWPTTNSILPDGSLQLVWTPAPEHPIEITAVYRWTKPDCLDLETSVKPEQPMPGFEVFLSSYFQPGFAGFAWVGPNLFAGGTPGWIAADVNPLVDGSYLMFPRDRDALLHIFDGRWEIPPNPVQWSITRWLAAPICMRRNAAGVSAILMAPPADCFAMSMPYNKTPADGVAGHQSLYLSLFGSDLKPGASARARCRLWLANDPSATDTRQAYDAYLKELKVQQPGS